MLTLTDVPTYTLSDIWGERRFFFLKFIFACKIQMALQKVIFVTGSDRKIHEHTSIDIFHRHIPFFAL